MKKAASMKRRLMALLLLAGLLAAMDHGSIVVAQQKCGAASIGSRSKLIKVTVATGGFFATPATTQTRYKEGEAISAVIWMTNMGDEPACVCSSSPLYQNKPQLLKNGKPVPYIAGRSEWLEKYWDSYEPCMDVTRPSEFYELKPHVPTKVDWFVISEGKQRSGNIKWYDTLGVGHYQLTLTRKLDCCAGPEVKSEPFTFDIVEDDFIYSESVNRINRLSKASMKAFALAWEELLKDLQIPEKRIEDYNVEFFDQPDEYFVYFHSRSREKFFAANHCEDVSAREKFGLIGWDAAYFVRKPDYFIGMRVVGKPC